jgi:hypothetical protein
MAFSVFERERSAHGSQFFWHVQLTISGADQNQCLRMTKRRLAIHGIPAASGGSAEAGWRIGSGRELAGGLTGRRIGRHLSRGGNGDTNPDVPIEMILAASWAVSLTGVLIAKAGEFVATANAIAIAGFGRGLDRDEWHGFSLRY